MIRLCLEFAIGVIEPVLFPFDGRMTSESPAHWFGPDEIGRDVFRSFLADVPDRAALDDFHLRRRRSFVGLFSGYSLWTHLPIEKLDFSLTMGSPNSFVNNSLPFG
jgi:hypothetical protein